MVCLIVNGDRLKGAKDLAEKLMKVPGMTSISFNINKEATNRILGEKVVNICGEGYIRDYIGDVKFRISPLSFYQVNPVQTQKLYETALNYVGLTGKETVFDLYCGVGTISLFLAGKAKKVIGVEIVQQAVRDARVNAEINEIKNTEFYMGAAESVVPKLYERGVTADVVVVDPPRKGCEESLLETIVQMRPERIVYVSCDSATLARDVKILGDRGYQVEKVQPVDMFPNCEDIETVCLLSLK